MTNPIPAPLPVAQDHPTIAPADFQVSAHDAQGHGVDIHFRVPPGLQRQVAELVASIHFPYRTPSDFYRHAAKHMAEVLVETAPVRSFVQQIAAVNAIMVEEENNIAFLKSVEKLASIVIDHTRSGRKAQATSLVMKVRSDVENMPLDSPWRDVYLEEIEARWGDLLRAAPMASGGFGVMTD